MSKKYYWLKLKDDFFTTREIKKLRRIAGGDTYTIIYLKMQLLSIKKEGLIIYEGTEENLVEQLSLELDEDEDNVKMTLAFLQANKLIEQLSRDEYLLNKVPESIGSETGSAERMRKMREKRNNVTPQLQPVTKSYTEIERRDREDIDIETETEKHQLNKKDIDLIMTEWNKLNLQNLKAINNNTKRYSMLKARIKEYSLDEVVQAIRSIDESDFLKGQNNRGWTITFDWLVRPNNFLKVLEGNYIDKEKTDEKYTKGNQDDNGTSNGDEIDWAKRAGIKSF